MEKAAQETHEAALKDVRELYGFTPWYFNLPDPGYEAGWMELMDPEGFYAKFGPSWPLATCSVLTALANLLNNYDQDVIGKDAYFKIFQCYTRSHTLKREDGKVVPWIDENIQPYTGDWISRTRLHDWAKTDPEFEKRKGDKHRGKDYNHSSYNDLIITGLVGLRPRADTMVEVNPLLPASTWDWFCLDNVLYHGRILTIVWDRTGERDDRKTGDAMSRVRPWIWSIVSFLGGSRSHIHATQAAGKQDPFQDPCANPVAWPAAASSQPRLVHGHGG